MMIMIAVMTIMMITVNDLTMIRFMMMTYVAADDNDDGDHVANDDDNNE